MNTTAMHGLAIGLLVSFGIVIAIASAFATIYRRHLRAMRRANRMLDPLAPLVGSRRRPLALPLPPRWMAVRSANTGFIREMLGQDPMSALAWSDALARCRERTFFISTPLDGWTLVIGAGIPDPSNDVDASYRFLTGLSRVVGEVHCYSADRVLNFHAWSCLRDGRVVRAYAWAGETLWNEGRQTLDERLLGLRCRAYGEEADPVRYGAVPAEQHNTERVILLARRWSIDPVVASETLLQQESSPAGDGAEGHSGPSGT
jgi:hypothetical protein